MHARTPCGRGETKRARSAAQRSSATQVRVARGRTRSFESYTRERRNALTKTARCQRCPRATGHAVAMCTPRRGKGGGAAGVLLALASLVVRGAATPSTVVFSKGSYGNHGATSSSNTMAHTHTHATTHTQMFRSAVNEEAFAPSLSHAPRGPAARTDSANPAASGVTSSHAPGIAIDVPNIFIRNYHMANGPGLIKAGIQLQNAGLASNTVDAAPAFYCNRNCEKATLCWQSDQGERKFDVLLQVNAAHSPSARFPFCCCCCGCVCVCVCVCVWCVCVRACAAGCSCAWAHCSFTASSATACAGACVPCVNSQMHGTSPEVCLGLQPHDTL